MTAQAKSKQYQIISQKKILLRNNHDYANEVKLFKIAAQMEKEKLPNVFIVNAIKTALEFEGVADLLTLWSEENEKNEKEEIISDIQDMIDACSQGKSSKEIYVKFNDLDAIAND